MDFESRSVRTIDFTVCHFDFDLYIWDQSSLVDLATGELLLTYLR